jgi:CubicO group peptidase (beta-lactamase class C family)
MKLRKAIRIIVVILMSGFLFAAAALFWQYPPEYIYRVQVWQASDAFDWQKFPFHPLYPAPQADHFDAAPDPRVAELFENLAGTDDWDLFLAENDTQAFIVIQDGRILYENYFNGTQRDSIVTSFSVAKSFTSALIGIAIDEGYIKSVNDPITTYLPELLKRDPRFKEITIRHLLVMASGLEYVGFQPSFLNLNNDDNLTSYYTDQRKIALEHPRIIAAPEEYFQYNKYHPQLLGMILERATGMAVTKYLQTRIWDKVGMEYGGSWSTDSTASGFEKMESGVNARAIDFAKFGVLFLNEGHWEGNQVISKAWVNESTQPPPQPGNYLYYPAWFSSLPGHSYYKYMWWGMAREGDAYDFAGEGDKGQYIYVSPQKNMVIIRNGIEDGIGWAAWLQLFYRFASQY